MVGVAWLVVASGGWPQPLTDQALAHRPSKLQTHHPSLTPALQPRSKRNVDTWKDRRMLEVAAVTLLYVGVSMLLPHFFPCQPTGCTVPIAAPDSDPRCDAFPANATSATSFTNEDLAMARAGAGRCCAASEHAHNQRTAVLSPAPLVPRTLTTLARRSATPSCASTSPTRATPASTW